MSTIITSALSKIGSDVYSNADTFISAVSDTVKEQGILRKLSFDKPSCPQKTRKTEYNHFIGDSSNCDELHIKDLLYGSTRNQIVLEDNTLLTELLGSATKDNNIITYKNFTYPVFEKLCSKLNSSKLDIIVSSSVWTKMFTLPGFLPNKRYAQVLFGIMGTIDNHIVYSDVMSSPLWRALNSDAIIAVPKDSIKATWSGSKIRIGPSEIEQECRVSLELTTPVSAALLL